MLPWMPRLQEKAVLLSRSVPSEASTKNWFQAISHHTLQVSFINDARKSEFGKCIIKLDQDVCWILRE